MSHQGVATHTVATSTTESASQRAPVPYDAGGVSTTVKEWISRSSVAMSHGATMLDALDKECERVGKTPLDTFGFSSYSAQLFEVHRTATDALMSAVHRSIFHYHINNTYRTTSLSDNPGQPSANAASTTQDDDTGVFHVATDPEEMYIHCDPMYDSDDEEQRSTATSQEDQAPQAAKPAPNNAAAAPPPAAAAAAPPSVDTKAKKREEAKKRRQEDEHLLLKERKVRDEKGTYMSTIGPYPGPKLTLRSLKSDCPIPSRKTLNQRPQLDQDPDDGHRSSSSSSDEDEESIALASASPIVTGDADTVAHLVAFLTPLSMDSLKKVSESAKVKLKTNSTHEEAVSDIVRSAVKLGCEKACVLMDKNKILDKVATQGHTTRNHILAQLATSIPTFLNSLSEDLLKLLGPTLGIPGDVPQVNDMWERIVAMGLCAVLTNLRPRPLRKIAQELNITVDSAASTEKHCEAVVFKAFPRERQRVKHSRGVRRAPGVCFSLVSLQTRVHGDLGVITFRIHNVALMRQDTERHYSPEFEYGNLRWSLLCMCNKDSLALYLCQQGTVHCKFIITVVNQLNHDDSVFNEGTQKFSSASAENDWGFNNVIKFDMLVDKKHGFVSTDGDAMIEVSIVLVEAPIGKAVRDAQATAAPGGGSAKPHANHKAPDERIVQAVANQLLESERLEATRKRIKLAIANLQKDEDKQRKEQSSRFIKSIQQLVDQAATDRLRIVRDFAERERREQQDRAREADRARQLVEQANELRRRVADLTDEVADLASRKKLITTELRDARKSFEADQQQLRALESDASALQHRAHDLADHVKIREAAVSALRAQLQELNESLSGAAAVLDHLPVAAPPISIPLDAAGDDVMRSMQKTFEGMLAW